MYQSLNNLVTIVQKYFKIFQQPFNNRFRINNHVTIVQQSCNHRLKIVQESISKRVTIVIVIQSFNNPLTIV